MDKNDCKPHFTICDWMIDTTEPLRAEYFRGYDRGIEAQVFGVSTEWTDEHYMLIEYSVVRSGDPYIDSYARGYRDGFEGLKPESPSLTSIFSRPPLIVV